MSHKTEVKKQDDNHRVGLVQERNVVFGNCVRKLRRARVTEVLEVVLGDEMVTCER